MHVTLCVQHHQIELIFVIFMTYNIILLAKQTKVIDSVYLFVSQHYTQILHKQLVKDRPLDALLMIYNKSIYTQRYSGIEAHLKHHSQLCKSCDRQNKRPSARKLRMVAVSFANETATNCYFQPTGTDLQCNILYKHHCGHILIQIL